MALKDEYEKYCEIVKEGSLSFQGWYATMRRYELTYEEMYFYVMRKNRGGIPELYRKYLKECPDDKPLSYYAYKSRILKNKHKPEDIKRIYEKHENKKVEYRQDLLTKIKIKRSQLGHNMPVL